MSACAARGSATLSLQGLKKQKSKEEFCPTAEKRLQKCTQAHTRTHDEHGVSVGEVM